MLEKGVIPPIAGLHQLNPRIKRIPNLKVSGSEVARIALTSSSSLRKRTRG